MPRYRRRCGPTSASYTEPTQPDLVVVMVGSFADPTFPPPTESGYESRKHPWLTLPATIARDGSELWGPAPPSLRGGEYAEVAERGHALLEAHPENAYLLYNLACCESLAGQTTEAIDHLRRAIDISEQPRTYAERDSEFDPIRDEPAFKELIASP